MLELNVLVADPSDVTLSINPLKLEEIERFSSQNFSEEECPTNEHTERLPNGKEYTEFYMLETPIAKHLKKYIDSSDKFYFTRGL